jgi:hypothetical protein
MTGVEVSRVLEPDGSVVLSAGRCRFHFRRPCAGVVEVTISGVDDGQFGTTTLDELRLALMRERPLEIFVDARQALAPAVSVSEEWTRFFSDHRHELKRVSVLVGSQVVELTVAIAQHLSRTGNLIQIFSDPEAFADQRARAAPGG